jgi:hypothetical protein
MRRYIYHYCSECTDSNGVQTVIDGIAELLAPITNMDGYHNLKTLVSTVEPYPRDDLLTITSLSYIGRGAHIE